MYFKTNVISFCFGIWSKTLVFGRFTLGIQIYISSVYLLSVKNNESLQWYESTSRLNSYDFFRDSRDV